ncbi:VaFE repeat-containing surface-anchored protein, partial [Corynebacterium guaraldiae]|uniref:VaFE repeat-containing surface-anchored protein n=1 Tax=Corynebacterium guaraldiae TaxID=3051103 RepID=UPI0018AB8C2F
MVTVPWAKADAAEPTDFVPNNTIGAEGAKIGGDHSWGQLVWAGAPPKGAKNPHTDNDVGWGWCIDYTVADPMLKTGSYKKSTAGAIRFDDPKFQNAAIGIALKLRDATAAGDKKLANRYSVYLAALVSDPSGRAAAIKFIHANDGGNVSGLARPLNGFDGNSEDFTANTGLRILKDNAQTLDEQFEADPSVTIPEQPADAFITVVGPNGEIRHNSRGGQRVVPVDQPGLPDDEGESKTPSISTNADFANGATEVVAGAQVNDTVKYENLVPGKEYTLSAELISKADGKTVLGKGEKTFTPKGAKGEVIVEITVDESVKEPVEAAVAFEELTSVEVDKDGKETPDNTSDNPIAEHKDINDKDQTVTSEEQPSESTTPEQPGESTTPENPDESTTPENPGEEPSESTTPENPDESTTPENPGESTTPKTTEPSESTTPGKPGDESGKPKISTNADFA